MLVDRGALARHLAAMPGPRRRPNDLANIGKTLGYLRDRFREARFTVREQSCRDALLGDGANLVARLPGARDDTLVVVAAHHDTVPGSPGADDNGSGLAALCELARLLPGRRYEATVELVAFDFEESNDPFGDGTASFAGSLAYVGALRRDALDLRAAFVYDLIAFTEAAPGSQRLPPGIDRLFPAQLAALQARGGRGDFVAALGLVDEGAASLLHAFGVAARSVDLPVFSISVPPGLPLRDLYRSDHVAFWEAGLPAVFLTDTANFRNPHYHRPTDLPETLDPDFWSRVVTATFDAVSAFAVRLP